jgi:hypothetical protein
MKLSDIPKKPIFEVPEGYFDRLPGIIQARAISTSPRKEAAGRLLPVLRYALPALIAAIVIWQLAKPTLTPANPEDILAGVQTEQLVLYLADADMSLQEILNHLEPENIPADAVEQEVYNLFADDELPDDDLLNNL